MTIRYLEKFIAADGTTTYTFPENGLDWTEDGPLRTAYGSAIGADGAHDFLGSGIAPKDMIPVNVSLLDVQSTAGALETDLDAMRAKLHIGALGKLYTLDSTGTRRWSRARLTAMPGTPRSVGQFVHQPASLRFLREPYWYDTSATTANAAVSSNYQSVTVTNPGNAYVKTGLVITITASAIGGFSNLILTNVTTGEQVRWNGYARSATSVLRIDNSDLSIKLLSDPGLVIGKSTSYIGQAAIGGAGVYSDAYALATLGPTQPGLITLAPGANTVVFQVDGSASYTYLYTFYGAWS